jgi:hypothetical protein
VVAPVLRARGAGLRPSSRYSRRQLQHRDTGGDGHAWFGSRVTCPTSRGIIAAAVIPPSPSGLQRGMSASDQRLLRVHGYLQGVVNRYTSAPRRMASGDFKNCEANAYASATSGSSAIGIDTHRSVSVRRLPPRGWLASCGPELASRVVDELRRGIRARTCGAYLPSRHR